VPTLPSRLAAVTSLAATLIVMSVSSHAQQHNSAHCTPLPEQPSSISSWLQSIELVELARQGFVAYEGDLPDARPLPKVSLRDLARKLEDSLRSKQRSGGIPIDPDAVYFTFHADSAPSQEAEVISLPKSILLCLVRPRDIVLLSDGSTHHITSIPVSIVERAMSSFLIPGRAAFLC
jgi:hypothetical protein